MAKEYKIGSFAQAVPQATPKKRVAKKATVKKSESKITIGGARPKVKNTTGFTNRSSGYLNPNAVGNNKSTIVKKKIANIKRKRAM